jgi:hypothetical protein
LKSIDVGSIQSLVRKDVVVDVVADHGHVIADCHHLSAARFRVDVRQRTAGEDA